MKTVHQYIDRHSGRVCNEKLFGDRIIRWLYHPVREQAPALFQFMTGPTYSRALSFFNYDQALSTRVLGNGRFLDDCGVCFDECLNAPESLDTARKVFERQIRYWQFRPMPESQQAVVSPADSRVLIGSLDDSDTFFIKDKLFSFDELLGFNHWIEAFDGGDFAVFRLTPDKYHYNHTPVSGEIVDFYPIDGDYHSCNPLAVVAEVTPYSKNKRVVTVIDTDVPGGSRVGRVAMIEIVALMIGEVVQAYSPVRYEDPQPLHPGMFVEKGAPKSLFRPGSSTVVLLFEKGRIEFDEDLRRNLLRQDVSSRFSRGFGHPLVETEVAVRSQIASALPPQGASPADIKVAPL